MLRDERGMTLTELMVTTVIMVVVTLGIYSAFEYAIFNYNYLEGRAVVQQEGRTAVDLMSRYVRMSETLVDGVGNDLTIQADADDDTQWETIRFYVVGTTLFMDYTDNAVVTTRRLVDNVRNVDVFTYFDSNGAVITDQYERPTKTKRVTMKLVVDDNPNQPLGALTLKTAVEMRNRQ
ncbi:MAG: prepilin-type N-terminal cleavage/methylation domain-containing protein [Actinobacteria bacterium]|nr:prepilin-type N-terminal cleavage/methylation domain-containing protein [Chloroflexota bacterium]MCL5292296.1 prepilin-type N-terminal cleavage/methylation domain-containing protein [Actinomycetota bacterium]